MNNDRAEVSALGGGCIDFSVLVSLSTDPFPLPFRNYDMNWLWKGETKVFDMKAALFD